MSTKQLCRPIRYFGGKGNIAKHILPLIPPHRTYVEPFGGSAAILFAKAPSDIEVYNDIDSGLVNFFRVLRDPEQFEQFHRRAVLTPHSREEHLFCRDNWQNTDEPVEKAWRFWVGLQQSFAGDLKGGWSRSLNESRQGMAGSTARWLGCIERLPEAHARLIRLQVEHKDFRELIPTHDREDTFFYLDPPYISETRKSGGYTHELTNIDHRELVEILLNLKGNAVLSGYQHSIYEPLESAGWNRIDIEVPLHAGHTGTTRDRRTESLWIRALQ